MNNNEESIDETDPIKVNDNEEIIDETNPIEASSCAICYFTFDEKNTLPTKLPCCERDTSTTKFCFRCLELLCENANMGNQKIGCCPRCRKYIQVCDDGMTIRSVPTPPKQYSCQVCRQSFARFNIIDHDRFLVCRACESGRLNPLRYQCEGCQRVQTISHPMYRYQATPNDYSTATWACHLGCGTYTHWRVYHRDLSRVPAHDAPEGWNLDEEVIMEVRRMRRQELQARRQRLAEERSYGISIILGPILLALWCYRLIRSE